MPWKAFMQSSALTNSDNVEHTLFRLCIALVQSAKYLVYALIGCYRYLVDVAGFPTDDIPSFPND